MQNPTRSNPIHTFTVKKQRKLFTRSARRRQPDVYTRVGRAVKVFSETIPAAEKKLEQAARAATAKSFLQSVKNTFGRMFRRQGA